MSQATSSTAAETRPEADPLPSKVGELGYVPPSSPLPDQAVTNDEPSLPARHPADRDHLEATTGRRSAAVIRNDATPAPNAAATTTASTAAPVPPTGVPNPNGKGWLQRLTWKGISPITILRIVLLLLFIGGTAGAWALTVMRVAADNQARGDDPFDDNRPDQPDDGRIRLPPSFSSLVFVHVSFTVVSLFELLFLERAIFHARAERYLFKHGVPRRIGSMATIGLAPWSRPPLPTYAAALAESGVGTGDVEDNLIAIPPPPAYGNTRGSTLLLAGLLPANLVRSISRASERMRNSQHSNRSRRTNRESELEEGRGRPLSYEASQEVDNAKRARDLEIALAKLEDDKEKLQDRPRQS